MSSALTRLRQSAPVEIRPVVLTAAEAAARETDMKKASLIGGIAAERGNLGPLFEANVWYDRNVYYRLGSRQPTVLRMSKPVNGSAIYIRGGRNACKAFELILNGVHRIKVDVIPAFGAAMIPLPKDIEIYQLAFEVPQVHREIYPRQILLVE